MLTLKNTALPEKTENLNIDKNSDSIFQCTSAFYPNIGFYFIGKEFSSPIHLNTFPAFKLYSQLRNSQSAVFQGIEFITVAEKKKVYSGNEIIGLLIRDKQTEQIFVFGLSPKNIHEPAPVQAKTTFSLMKKVLEENDFHFTDIVRTWFYNKDILSWYSDFNEIRTNFYSDNNIFKNVLPASTGIGAENIYNAAISCGFHAVKKRNGEKSAVIVESPLQDSAEKYKSSFSRAVEVNLCDYKKLYISGTASINKEGKTIHVGNCAKQIEETMRVVDAILKSKNISWGNISRAIAYFRNYKDIYLFNEFIKENNIFPFPHIAVQATICRENLLFEIEVDAIIPKSN